MERKGLYIGFWMCHSAALMVACVMFMNHNDNIRIWCNGIDDACYFLRRWQHLKSDYIFRKHPHYFPTTAVNKAKCHTNMKITFSDLNWIYWRQYPCARIVATSLSVAMGIFFLLFHSPFKKLKKCHRIAIIEQSNCSQNYVN